MKTYSRTEAAAELQITRGRLVQLLKARSVASKPEMRDGRAMLVITAADLDKLRERTNGRPPSPEPKRRRRPQANRAVK